MKDELVQQENSTSKEYELEDFDLYDFRPDGIEERSEPFTPYNEDANGGRWWED